MAYVRETRLICHGCCWGNPAHSPWLLSENPARSLWLLPGKPGSFAVAVVGAGFKPARARSGTESSFPGLPTR